ncbi:MAG: roadblock/LC7 domain-containing protein [Candidatus Jordarchaeum sp.]|uniref:roadblock/LC7 domain-containing protein n=1 Tax=Candidatus Jordarchaeum sp. TaxID=2823881 RepID=UPI00404A8ADA
MSRSETEKMVADLMDKIPEIEGILLLDKSGNVSVGQTITQMNHSEIAKNAAVIIASARELNKSIEKGDANVAYVEGDNGYAVMANSEKAILLAIISKDAAPSLGLIIRDLKIVLSRIKI